MKWELENKKSREILFSTRILKEIRLNLITAIKQWADTVEMVLEKNP